MKPNTDPNAEATCKPQSFQMANNFITTTSDTAPVTTARGLEDNSNVATLLDTPEYPPIFL